MTGSQFLPYARISVWKLLPQVSSHDHMTLGQLLPISFGLIALSLNPI